MFVVSILVISITAFAVDTDVVVSGYCGGEGDGTNLEWKIDVEGTLTISGTGKMADYRRSNLSNGKFGTSAPWGEYSDEITSIKIENGVEYIGDFAFSDIGLNNKTVPETIVIPRTVKSMGEGIFCYSGIVSEIIFEEGLEELSDRSLYAANRLKYITLPSTLKYLGEQALGSFGLEEIIVSEENPYFKSIDGVLYSKDGTKLIQFTTKITGEYTIPDHVTTVGACSFWASQLSKVIIPENVKILESQAFYAFGDGKADFIVHGRLEEIGSNVFIGLEEGTNIYFLGGAPITIYETDQWGNSSFGGIKGAFDGIINLYYLEGTEGWEFDENGLWNGYEVKPFEAKDLVIASGYCGGEGDGTNLEWKITSDGVLTISGEGRMKDYGDFGETYMEDAPWVEYKDKIKSLVLEEGITYIGGCAFFQNPFKQYFSGQLVIPESVTEIGIGAFAYARSITGDIYIPENVEKIGFNAFMEVGADSITVSENNRFFASFEGMFCSKDMKKIIVCPMGKTGELVIPESVTTIGFGAFRFCENLTGTLVLPKNLQSIQGYAFYGCSGLEGKLYIPKGIRSLSSLVFSECGIDEYYFYGDAPSGVVGLGEGQVTFDSDDTIYYPAGNETWEIVDGKWKGYTAIPWEVPYTLGDVNDDGKINVVDANLVRRYSAKLITLGKEEAVAADVNGDGKINVVDANLIRRYSAKLITVFPVAE